MKDEKYLKRKRIKKVKKKKKSQRRERGIALYRRDKDGRGRRGDKEVMCDKRRMCYGVLRDLVFVCV